MPPGPSGGVLLAEEAMKTCVRLAQSLLFLLQQVQEAFFQGAGVGCRVGLCGCLLDPHLLCETAFHRGCCKASGEQHIHRCCDAFGLHLEGTAGLGGFSAAFINHGPVIALQAASC